MTDHYPPTYHYAKAIHFLGLLENTLDDPKQKTLLSNLRHHLENAFTPNFSDYPVFLDIPTPLTPPIYDTLDNRP
jgi:hypothetical protein